MSVWRNLYFNLIAPGYALLRQPGADEREAVRRLLSPPAAARLLDAGSGAGQHARDLLRHCPEARVTAVEPAFLFRALSLASTAVQGLRGRLDHRAASVTRLPFPDDWFDGALCLFVLWAVKDRKKALSELHRVLKPGAVLVLGEFAQGPGGTDAPGRRQLRLPFGHAPLSGPEDLAALVAPLFAVDVLESRPYALLARCLPVKPDRP